MFGDTPAGTFRSADEPFRAAIRGSSTAKLRFRAWHTLPTFDLDFLRLLAEVVDEEPPQEKDAVMLGMLGSIGIEKGKPFEPADPALLEDAVAEAEAHMSDYFLNRAFEPHWADRQWLKTKSDDNFGFSFYGDGRLDYDRRAGAFTYWATWAPKRLGRFDPAKLPASYYLKGFRDSSGALFRGDQLYRLRIAADIPVRDFWSVVVYEIGTNGFIRNEQNRVGVSSHDTLRAAADGSVEIFIGPQPPDGQEDNWIPTAGRDFRLIIRFYGPEMPLFDKTWTADDVARAN